VAALPVAAVSEQPPEIERTLSLAVGSVLYAAMLGGGMFWLWVRDRLDVLPQIAVDQHGPLLASGLGLAVGVAGAGALRVVGPRVRAFTVLEHHTRELFAGVSPAATMCFLLAGVVGEEVFFRAATQDAFGLLGAVLLYGLLHGSIAGLAWLPFTLAHALVLGLIVEFGFGLLGSATAHAIMNHLTLRRILCD
jgi:hypothetical protein